MKVLFVYGGYENLGIQMLSAVLKEAGHETALVFDPRLFADHYTSVPALARRFDRKAALLEQAVAHQPDLVAFSVVTEEYAWACELARELKARLEAPIVFGGIHPSSVPGRVIAKDFVDYVIVGEGEGALLELAEALERGERPTDIANLWVRAGDTVHRNPPRPLIPDLDALPFPDKALFYEALPFLRREYMTMTSRGCPHACTYCYNNHLRRMYQGKGRYLRRRSPRHVLDELVAAKATYPLERVQFYDDIFTSDRAWLEAFASGYRREVALPFWCSVSPAHVTPEIVQVLAAMGCWEVQMGVQTVNEELRREVLRRRDTIEQARRAVALFRAAGIKCVADNIGGLPGEGEEHFVESLRFYNQVRPSRISNYYLRYYPSTDIVSIAREAGILDDARIEALEEGLGSGSFALGGTRTDHSQAERLHLYLELLLLLPRPVNELILARRLHRFFPRTLPGARAAIRMVDVLRENDINAQRYLRKYIHFLSDGRGGGR